MNRPAERQPVRTIQPYYEAEGAHAVHPEVAAQVVAAAAEQLSRFACILTVKPPRGVRLGEPTKPVPVDKLKIGEDNHTLLLTRREFSVKDNREPYTTGYFKPRMFKGELGGLVSVRLMDQYELGMVAVAIDTAQHEVGHSFGLGHCSNDECTMIAINTHHITPSPDFKTDFCDDCAGDLELASYQALAHQLRASS